MAACASRRDRAAADRPVGPHLFLIDPEVNKLYETRRLQGGRQACRARRHPRAPGRHHPAADRAQPVTHQGELPAGAAEGNGFRVTVEMTSLLGTAGEDFASILNSLGYRVKRTPKVAAPAVAAEATAEAPALEEVLAENPATVDAAAEAPVEAVTADAAPAVDTDVPPTTVVEAAPETAETAPAAPAEPEFDEVWSPSGKRPDNKRHEHRRPARGRNPAGSPAAGAQPSSAGPPAGRKAKCRTSARRGICSPSRNSRARVATIIAARPISRVSGPSSSGRARRNAKRRSIPIAPFAKLAALRDRKAE
jgi:ATP-dependent RNA helicase SUPV3L1/SUV3